MTRIRIVGVDDDFGSGGRVFFIRLDLVPEGEDIAETPPGFSPELEQLLEVARRCGVDLLHGLGLVEAAKQLRDTQYSFSIDDPWFKGTLEQNSYGVALATGFVLAALGVEEGSPEVVATGVLDADNLRVTSVVGRQLNDKAEACREADALLLCPSGQHATSEDSYSLPEPGTLESAVLITGGASLMQALLRGCQCQASTVNLWNCFLTSHAEIGLLPHKLAKLQSCFNDLVGNIDVELRASVIAKSLSLGACASLASEFEQLLRLVANCEPDEPQFEAVLTERAREILTYGVKTSSGEMLSAVAWLFMAMRWVFGGEKLADRLSPVGIFFRELLGRAQDPEHGQAEEFILHTLADLGLRSEGLVRTGEITQDIAKMVADDPSGNVVAIYKESERDPQEIEPQKDFFPLVYLDRLIYEIEADSPMQLFDFDRAENQAFQGVIKINLQDFNLKILWRNGLGIFPPSIDTLHFIGDLSTAFQDERAEIVTSVVDIGCGTGVLGLLAAKHFPRVSQVHFIDIEPGVREILSANVLVNWPSAKNISASDVADSLGTPFFPGDVVEVNEDGRTIRLVFHNASADAVLPRISKDLPDGKFSVAIIAPPYLPIREPLPVPIWPAAAGTGLLEWAVSTGGDFTKEMYISFGEVAKRHFDLAASKANVKPESMGRKVVQFRIPGLVELFDVDHWGRRLREGSFAGVGDMRVSKESYEEDMERVQKWLKKYAPEQFRQTVEKGGQSLPPFVHTICNRHLKYS